ncbi:MAG TPA: hypothetical protein PL124_12765, partial [Candidatus Cloacimonadota bacterium]|nr:hypothetical protein [Candidatus Cloacimonadota bacterium]
MAEVKAKYFDTDQWMKAPNGKKTKLNERQWLQVRTPNFLNWFGDWINDPENASKVVDENGEPMVVYHGTVRQFSEFSKKAPSRHIEMPGFYFTPNAEIAENFAQDEYTEIRDNDGWVVGAEGGGIYPVFLSVRNPVIINVNDTLATMTNFHTILEKINDGISSGHDGTIINGWADGSGDTQMAAFSPTQIKSATANVGTFDPENADIRYMLQNHYHGSGAFFDRFDVKYIGTGEGAQAFGWGIYVSERKGVAEDYAERVGGKNNNLVLTIGNNEYNLSDFNNWFIDDDAIPEKDFPLEASQLMIDLLHEAKDWGGNTSGTLQGDFEIIQSYHNFHTVAIAKAIEGFIDIEQLGFSLDVDWNPLQLPDHVIPIEDQDEYFEYWRYPEHYFEPIRKTKANIERALKLIDRSAYYFETIVGEYVNAESNAELGGKLIDQINYDIQSAKALHNYVQEKNVQIKLGEGNRNLYTLNVWENHTEDTLDWFGKPTEEQINKINAALLTRKGKESDLAKFEIVDGAVYAVDRKLGIRVSMTDGREIYLTLKTAVTRTAQRTSEFLLRAGIDGIKYPVNATSGGTGKKGFNYVIFDADQITITNHVRYKMLNEDLAARLKAAQERLTRTHRDPIAIAEEVAEEMGLEP